MEDEDRVKFDGEEYYVKSSDDMRKLFPDEKFPGACDNTLKIASRVDYDFDFNKDYLPDFPVEDESLSVEEYLRKKVLIGAEEKYQEIDSEIQERINYELEVINSMGFASYFLIVGDLIDFAKLGAALFKLINSTASSSLIELGSLPDLKAAFIFPSDIYGP